MHATPPSRMPRTSTSRTWNLDLAWIPFVVCTHTSILDPGCCELLLASSSPRLEPRGKGQSLATCPERAVHAARTDLCRKACHRLQRLGRLGRLSPAVLCLPCSALPVLPCLSIIRRGGRTHEPSSNSLGIQELCRSHRVTASLDKRLSTVRHKPVQLVRGRRSGTAHRHPSAAFAARHACINSVLR